MSEEELVEWAKLNSTFKSKDKPKLWKNSLNRVMKELQKVDSYRTWNFVANDLLEGYVRRDINGFRVIEEQVGSQKATEMYAEILKRNFEMGYNSVKERLRIEKVDLEAFMRIVKMIFHDWGCISEIVGISEEGSLFRIYTCPYAEFAWAEFGKQICDDFNKKVQVMVNETIYRGLLQKAGLGERYDMVFPKQICNYDPYCEAIFFRRGLDPNQVKSKLI